MRSLKNMSASRTLASRRVFFSFSISVHATMNVLNYPNVNRKPSWNDVLRGVVLWQHWHFTMRVRIASGNWRCPQSSGWGAASFCSPDGTLTGLRMTDVGKLPSP
ncbi:hypothetical protein OH76DRAFT_190167 [Lentinus brumalis]|uniref:Uncharacterized protein n=1 Tax=Lentinus brumalis TaxID=2498619 RepID=A0A371CMY4_9APHY|nr:hypothetical protein OH76DRAFT_190167 [Polyporus brumalis]